jgi:peptidoglycan/LPS O-acetylase OafA/YrhL
MAKLQSVVRPLSYPVIDGIRFYAALMVFIEHTVGAAAIEYYRIPVADITYHSPRPWLSVLMYVMDGNHGVDVFFIISGFLMSRIVLGRKEPFHYGAFLKNRFLRIYPAFFISLIVCAAADVLLFQWPWKPWDFIKDLFFLNAISALNVTPYNHVSWSLGYEFAFYAVIPALLLMSRWLDRRLASILMLVCAYVLLPDEYIRIVGLFIGAVIGAFDDIALRRFARVVPLWLVLTAYFACGVLKAVWFPNFLDYLYCFWVIAGLAFIKVVWDDENPLSRFLSTKPLRMLGTFSYSIYLYHSIVGAFVLHKTTPMQPSTGGLIWYFTLTSILTLAIAYASYVLVERRYFRFRSAPADAGNADALSSHSQWVQPNKRTPQ